ncbi:MAG TPA: hypothetical protein VK586_03170, partial [Streptosporangiaceae bacterium]|nr:hypothetical protein [Streptosporangiaceae bacterium]
MGLELSATPVARTFQGLGTRASQRWPGDVLAVILLVALPVLVFGVPALLGHAVLPGDDLTQNYPLRVLAGRQLGSGQLPLYNPYLWSGAPLLGGWNAGAAYPLTALFAVLPATAAWTLNMIITWAIAGVGMFFFLRALRLATGPATLGALSFAFAGAMSAQVSHFGLVAGMSWVPVQLLGVLRLSQARSRASRLGWIAVLAGAIGLTILAGEPRAIADAGVIVFIYAAWRIARLGRRCAPAGLSVAAAALLGVALGAVQWLPGLAAVGASQRGAASMYLFNSGSLPAKWLLLMLVPDLMGGSGSLGQPAFFSHYNLTEVTGYVGILPLVAAIVLLGRVRLRPRPPEWVVWHVLALVGVVLALGGNTPVGHLLFHLPFFGDQRLQSRNILVTDLALAVLLAYWADHPLSERSQRFLRASARRWLDREVLLGVLAPLAMIGVVVLGLAWGAGLLNWLGVSPGAASAGGRLKPWLAPYALTGAGAIAFVIFGRRLRPKLRSRWLGGFVAADLIVFTLLAVVAVLPGLDSSASAATTAAAAKPSGLSVPAASAVRPIAALGYPGRFAVYDPDQVAARQLTLLGAPDLNVLSGTPSVQGYTSLVDGRYAAATGSHQATGEGQDVLDPGAVGNGTLDQLNTSVLLTVPAYLITPGGSAPAAGGSGPADRPAGPAPGPPGAGQRDVAADHQATWYLGTPLRVSRLEVPDADARQDAAAGLRLGLITPGGGTRWFPATAPSASLLTIRPPRPVTSVAVIAAAGARPSHLGPVSVTEPAGRVLVADGQLQDSLAPPRWGYAGRDGSFAVFANRFAAGPLRLEPIPGHPAPGASVRRVAGSAANPAAAAVASPRGVRVIRSVAAAAGWTATWHPRGGGTVTVPVRRAGLVQSVDLPAGRGIVTWSYTPPSFIAGFALSAGATAVILGLAIAVTVGRSRRRRSGPGADPGPGSPARSLTRQQSWVTTRQPAALTAARDEFGGMAGGRASIAAARRPDRPLRTIMSWGAALPGAGPGGWDRFAGVLPDADGEFVLAGSPLPAVVCPPLASAAQPGSLWAQLVD